MSAAAEPVLDRLRQALAARGAAWPAPLEHVAVTTSTNDVVREKARRGAPEWTAVLADTQSAGRGRQGRVWMSPPGNLFLSVLLRPPPPADGWTVLPLLAGLAVAEAAGEMGVEARLKWPNDVVVGSRKLAGILVEASSGAAGLEWVVAGIGMNVGLDREAMPPEIRDTATSLHLETGREIEVTLVAAAVLARLGVCYDRFVRDGPSVVRRAWRERSLPWWGRAVEAVSGSTRLVGIARDVDEHGALILEMADGRSTALRSGEVREVRPSRD